MMNHSPEPGKAHSTIDKVNVVASIQNGDASNDTVRNFANRISQMCQLKIVGMIKEIEEITKSGVITSVNRRIP